MYYFRMVEPDFTPLPVYEAMRTYATSVTPALYPGTHQEDHWALDYEGYWEMIRDAEAILGAYRQATAPGDRLRFTFAGTALTLTPGPGAGEVEVSVDDGAARRISLDGRPVQLVRSWRQERHAITLTVLSGQVSVDALAVQRPWRHPLWLLPGMVALGIAVVWGARAHRR
jgi:hypothetical protein